MKIGIEATTVGTRTTGTNRYLACLLEQLNNTENTVITFQPPEKNFLINDLAKRISKKLYRNFRLKNEMENSGIDCAIFPDYYMPRNFKKPSAIIIHDLSFISHPQFYPKKFTAFYNYMIRETLRETPVIVTISEHTKKNICKYLRVKEENISLLQGYSKLNNVSGKLNITNSGSSPYFLFVGHIEPRKNLHFLIEGFLRWKERHLVDYKLKIVGELWIKSSSTLSLINKYKNHPDIEFTGYVSEQDLQRIYQNAAAFIHTSFEEGFGFPVLEAMHYNLPVLCSRNIATEEISKPNSIVIDPSNSLSYYNGLERLSDLIQSESKINYNIKYSPALMKSQLDELLDTLDFKVRKKYKSKMPEAKTNEEALEKTLIYSSLFNSGIRNEKLHQQIFDLCMTKKDMNNTLLCLSSQGIVKQHGGFTFLNNAEAGYYKIKSGTKKIDKLKLIRLLRFLKKIPFISSISFSGGTTHYGAENHDDLDLFIISKPYTVYIVYLIIHVYSLIFKARKELCANYLIDETNLEINHSYDPYTAHQIISLQAFKNCKLLNRFWKENEWVKNFFPNFEIKNERYKKPVKIYIVFKPLNKILLFCYRYFYRQQLLKLEQNNSLKLNEHCIKLHTNDHSTKIIAEFEKVWKDYCCNKVMTENPAAEDEKVYNFSLK